MKKLLEKVLRGEALTDNEAYSLCEVEDAGALYDAAAEITRCFVRPVFDPCSIINARSGNCSENCKWCAQSRHFRTEADHYPLLAPAQVLEQARYDAAKGVKRFSLVTSGKGIKGRQLEQLCDSVRQVLENTPLRVCCSLGLLGPDEMMRLREAGVTRYHCNLETAPSYFPQLCTTHTIEDKIATIAAAREAGLEVCSGGIIGMGETRRQRMELALTLRRVQPVSIPLNILNPIPGTPLEHAEPISDEEILRTVAMFRFVHPAVDLRFAGGRKRLSRDTQMQCMRIGVNSAIVGDLLTTVGSEIDADMVMAQEAGYRKPTP